MSSATITKQINQYLPLLTKKQQELLLEMVKSILHVEPEFRRISKKQYNLELEAAIKEVKDGKTIKHKDVLKKTAKW